MIKLKFWILIGIHINEEWLKRIWMRKMKSCLHEKQTINLLHYWSKNLNLSGWGKCVSLNAHYEIECIFAGIFRENLYHIELLFWYIFCEVYNVLNPHVYFRLVSWRLFIMSRLTSPPILLNTKDCKKRNLELGFYMMQSFRTVMHVDYVVMSYYFKIWKMWK